MSPVEISRQLPSNHRQLELPGAVSSIEMSVDA